MLSDLLAMMPFHHRVTEAVLQAGSLRIMNKDPSALAVNPDQAGNGLGKAVVVYAEHASEDHQPAAAYSSAVPAHNSGSARQHLRFLPQLAPHRGLRPGGPWTPAPAAQLAVGGDRISPQPLNFSNIHALGVALSGLGPYDF